MKKRIFLLSILALTIATAFDASARYRGDLNGDDRVDLADMVYLAKAIKAGSSDKALDVNASGKVDDYDLHKLADIIISGKLTEDSGMNVGIGGWEDSGEDYGGTVKAPAFTTRSAEDTRFYINNPKSESDGRYSMEFGISEGDEVPCAILFSIRLPKEMSFDASKTVQLDPAFSSTHNLYGTPKFIKENPDDKWNDDHVLRFIVMSPALNAFPNSKGRLGRIYYSVSDCWNSPVFVNCQSVSTGESICVDIPEHLADYNGNFMPVEVSSVWFDQTDMNLTEGDEVWLYANIDPEDATDQNLVWSSSDESIATVHSEDGRNAIVKAIKKGEAVITATSSNGLSASCKVTVESGVVAVTEVKLDKTSLELTEGDTATLTATVNPSDATDRTLTWTSSDASVASVSADGEVKALKPGSATITVSSSNGKTASCVVTVNAKVIEVTSVSLDRTSLELKEGDTATLTATVNPADATDKSLKWTSTDSSVVSVSANGEVKALKAGTATVIASSSNGKTAKCEVTVAAKEIRMEAIMLDAEEISLEKGSTHQFIATVYPAETTSPELEWWSDHESVAKVDGFGLVTMIGEGSTIVHVRSVRWPEIEATCRINVTDAVEGIIADDTPCDIYTSNGQLIKKAVPPSEIQYLERGIYIIRQGGKTTKLLK